MTDWELILTMVGEKATTDITVAEDSKGLEQCKDSAKEGGNIAGNTRKELEQKIGKSLISENNFLHLTDGKNKRIGVNYHPLKRVALGVVSSYEL